MTCGKYGKNSSLMERLFKSIQDRSLRLAVLGSGYISLKTKVIARTQRRDKIAEDHKRLLWSKKQAGEYS